MARRTSKKSLRRRSKPRRVRKARRSSSRRSTRTGSRSSRSKAKLSVQRLKSFFPDIALSKLDMANILLDTQCNDISTSAIFDVSGATGNMVVVALNSNPNGGPVLWNRNTVPATAIMFPVLTYTSKYKRYRCFGATIAFTFTYADNAATDTVANSVARPFVVTGFPFQSFDSNSANYWTGAAANGFTAITIPAMKYGFKKVSGGLGGKTSITFKKFFKVSKIYGMTDNQWMNAGDFLSFPQSNATNPNATAYMGFNLADLNTSQVRVVSVSMKLTQHGRWEGQQADYT